MSLTASVVELEIQEDREDVRRDRVLDGLEAEAQDGTSLVASVKELSKDQRRVSVKVGYLLGDGDAARRILSEVEGRLAAAKAEAEERRRRWRPSGTAPTTTTQPPTR